MKKKNNDHKKYLFLLLSGLLGLLFFMLFFSETLNPFDTGWILSERNDHTESYIGWEYYRRDQWHFPIGVMKNYFYPDGTTINHLDAVPLMALLFKTVNPILPNEFQYFGLWIMLCYILQGIFGYLLSKVIVKNDWNALLSSILFISSPIILWRVMFHIALISHWLILLALWMTMREDNKFRVGLWIMALCLSLEISPYIFVMLVFIMGIDLLNKKYVLKQLTYKQAITDLAIILPVILIVIYSIGLMYTGSNADFGFGVFSMNLNALWNPALHPPGYSTWSKFLPEAKRVYGHYEGFSYLGIGVMILAIINSMFILKKWRALNTLKKYWPYFVICILLTCLALSNRIYFGDGLLIEFNIPEGIAHFFGMIRSSGRFFWPVYYLIITASLCFLAGIKKPQISGMILSLVVIVQLYDLSPALAFIGGCHENKSYVSTMKSPFWDMADRDYAKLYFLPKAAPQYDPHIWASIGRKLVNNGFPCRTPFNSLNNLKKAIGDLEMGLLNDDTLYIITAAAGETSKYTSKIDHKTHLVGSIDGFCVVAPNFYSNHPEFNKSNLNIGECLSE